MKILVIGAGGREHALAWKLAQGARVQKISDHVVIIGYGMAGRLIAHALKDCGQKVIALELNAETVRAARAEGEPVYYADGTSPEALGHAHLERARALVILVNDPHGAIRVVDTARRVAPHVPVLMRTRYVGERAELLRKGATDVVAEPAHSGDMRIRQFTSGYEPLDLRDRDGLANVTPDDRERVAIKRIAQRAQTVCPVRKKEPDREK